MQVLRQALQEWYNNHQRDLPWRHTKDPYAIWLSEIILQQTKVSQGLPYYNSFIDEFDTITDLANAKEDKNFLSLRNKIHAFPEPGDADEVRTYGLSQKSSTAHQKARKKLKRMDASQ